MRIKLIGLLALAGGAMFFAQNPKWEMKMASTE